MSEQRNNVRIAVLGNADSGKSSCIGTLTSGSLDNGSGLSRKFVMVHAHEFKNGQTTTISHHSMGYKLATDANSQDGLVPFEHVPIGCSASDSLPVKTRCWKELVDNSHHTVEFVDLAGQQKYAKCSLRGLSGTFPDYVIVMLNSLSGCVPPMAAEHLKLVIALQIPFFVVISKIDLAPPNVLQRTRTELQKYLNENATRKRLPNKQKEEVKLLELKSHEDVAALFQEEKLERDAIQSSTLTTSEAKLFRIRIPVLEVSFVKGTQLELLHNILSRCTPHPLPKWTESSQAGDVCADTETETKSAITNVASEEEGPLLGEFSIDSTFKVEGVGLVVSGIVMNGRIRAGTVMLLGPLDGMGSSQANAAQTLEDELLALDLSNDGSSNINKRNTGQVKRDKAQRQREHQAAAGAASAEGKDIVEQTPKGTIPRQSVQQKSRWIHSYHYIPVTLRTIHQNRACQEHAIEKGNNCAIALRAVNRKERDDLPKRIFPGMFLIDPLLKPRATSLFQAQISVMHHPSTIRPGYEATIHMGMIRETIKLLDCRTIDGSQPMPFLRTKDAALCTFRFVKRAQYLHDRMIFFFREGLTKAKGKVTKIHFTAEDVTEIKRVYKHNKQLIHDARQTEPPSVVASQKQAVDSTSTAAIESEEAPAVSVQK